MYPIRYSCKHYTTKGTIYTEALYTFRMTERFFGNA